MHTQTPSFLIGPFGNFVNFSLRVSSLSFCMLFCCCRLCSSLLWTPVFYSKFFSWLEKIVHCCLKHCCGDVLQSQSKIGKFFSRLFLPLCFFPAHSLVQWSLSLFIRDMVSTSRPGFLCGSICFYPFSPAFTAPYLVATVNLFTL